MKLATLALGGGTLIAALFGSTAPAAAGDDAFIGVQVGPLRVGAGFDGRHHRHHHHYRGSYDSYRACYDCGDGLYADRDYVPRYDRRYSPDPWPAYWSYYGYRNYDDGNYHWYRHHRHHHHHHHHHHHFYRDWDYRY